MLDSNNNNSNNNNNNNNEQNGMEKKLTRYSDGIFFFEVNRLMKKGNLSEPIKRQVEDEFQGEFGEYAATEIETVENEDTAETEDMVENEVDLVQRKS